MQRLTLLALTLITIITACERTSGPDNGLAAIKGKWTLVEYYGDPGNGTGNWGPPPNNQTNLEFHEDGSITSDVFLLQEIKRYEVVNDSAVAFYNANDQPYTMGFVLKGNSLELKPICSEGCGLRFKRK